MALFLTYLLALVLIGAAGYALYAVGGTWVRNRLSDAMRKDMQALRKDDEIG